MKSETYFWDQNGLGYHSKLGLYRTKNSSGYEFDSHTRIHPILPKTPRISATIKSKLNFKNIFPDIVYNVKNKIDFAKNRGAEPPAPWIRHCSPTRDVCADKKIRALKISGLQWRQR